MAQDEFRLWKKRKHIWLKISEIYLSRCSTTCKQKGKLLHVLIQKLCPFPVSCLQTLPHGQLTKHCSHIFCSGFSPILLWCSRYSQVKTTCKIIIILFKSYREFSMIKTYRPYRKVRVILIFSLLLFIAKVSSVSKMRLKVFYVLSVYLLSSLLFSQDDKNCLSHH